MSRQLVSRPGEPMPNARRFLEEEYGHQARCLLLHQGGQFYRWDGTCWPAVEDPLLKSALYCWFENKEYAEGDKTKPFAPTARKIADLMDATRAITIIDTATPTPSWLDPGSYPANEMIACDNGLVHWPTRTLHDHQPGYYVHHSVPFAFNATVPPPARWLAFLGELWADDTGTISAVQEMFGYLVSGDTSQQKMFLLVGPKRGGKGTIARVLTRMIGRHNVAGPTLASLGANFGLQDLIGKPVAIISDARIGWRSDASLIAERLLSVSGEDLQNVDRKYLPPWSGYLPTRFVVLTNELPRFTDSSGALASRFVVLMLHKSFYGKENPALTEELCEELPAIFNWSLDGLEKLRARGRFQQPQASKDAMQELEDLASPVGAFIRDRCTIGPDRSVDVDALYRDYRQWCDDNGRPPSSRQLFGRDLRAARPEVKVIRPRNGSSERPRQYVGIALCRSADHADQEEVVQTVRSPENCSSNGPCPACDGEGCPWCQPEASRSR